MAKTAAILVAAVWIALDAAPALAHKMNVFAYAEGKAIRGEAYFRGQVPVRDAPVTVLGPNGEKLAETTTNGEGKFSVDARFRCDHRVVVDGGAGHTAEYKIEAGELPQSLPAPPAGSPLPPAGEGSGMRAAGEELHPAAGDFSGDPPPPAPADVEALRVQVVKLREEIDAFQHETRLRDVLGGVGYILGAMGLVMYVVARRRNHGGRGS